MSSRLRKEKSRVDPKTLVISVLFHVAVGSLLFFLAAREGVLGTKLKELTAFKVKEEEKPPEPKPEPPKVEPPKIEEKAEPAAVAAAPPPVALPATAAPLPTVVAPDAPAAAIQADFQFDDGAKVVSTTSDPIEAFRGFIELSFRTRWMKPEGIDDTRYVAEVDVSLEKDGRIGGYQWVRGSDDKAWDDSVRSALTATRSISRPPPAGFPQRFRIRFDAIHDTEAVQ